MLTSPDPAIVYPMVALAAWTSLILMLVAARRFQAARQRLVTPGDFRLGESANVPPQVTVVNRNYMNLLEVPVLFYAASLAFYAGGLANDLTVTLAWSYVTLRLVHSVIHLSYNNVLHRLLAFAVSNLVLLALWVQLGLVAGGR